MVEGNAGKWFEKGSGANAFTNRFEDALPFKAGLAGVRQNGRWGFINPSGSTAIPCNYSRVDSFDGDYAVVVSNKLCGIVGRAGGLVVHTVYFDIKSLGQGYFAANRGGKYGIIDSSGKQVLEPAYEAIGSMSSGVFLARIDRLWGAMDLTGTPLLPFEFPRLGRFSEGLFAAQKRDDLGVVYLKPGGSGAFEGVFVDGRSFMNGKAFVLGQNGRWNIIDKSGVLVTNTAFTDVGYPAFGMISVEVKNKWGFCDMNGWLQVPAVYDKVSQFDEYGRALVVRANRLGYVSTNGTVLLPLKERK